MEGCGLPSPALQLVRERLLILGSRVRDSTHPLVRRVQVSQTAGVLSLFLGFSDRGAGVAAATLAPIALQEALRCALGLSALWTRQRSETSPNPRFASVRPLVLQAWRARLDPLRGSTPRNFEEAHS